MHCNVSAMSSQACSSWKASLRSGATTIRLSPPCSSADSSSTLCPADGKMGKEEPAGRKPKRTSFACLECSKTFPSQQAMAGHCSVHTRAGARRVPAARQPILPPASPVLAAPSNSPELAQYRRHNVDAGRPLVQVQVQRASGDNMPPVQAIRYVPYARPISNQMMVTPLPYLELHGRTSVSPAVYPGFRPAPVQHMPAAGHLAWGTIVPIYRLPPSSVDGAAPSEMSSTSTNLPGYTVADHKTLRSGSGSNGQRKRTLPLLDSLMVSGGHQGADRKGKRALVMDSGDQESNKKGDPVNDGCLDLELRL